MRINKRDVVCFHRCKRIAPEVDPKGGKPFVYLCLMCKQKLKILSGVVVEDERGNKLRRDAQ